MKGTYAHGQKIGYNIANQKGDEWQEATPNLATLHYFNAICLERIDIYQEIWS